MDELPEPSRLRTESIVAGQADNRAVQLRRSLQSERHVFCVHPPDQTPDVAGPEHAVRGRGQERAASGHLHVAQGQKPQDGALFVPGIETKIADRGPLHGLDRAQRPGQAAVEPALPARVRPQSRRGTEGDDLEETPREEEGLTPLNRARHQRARGPLQEQDREAGVPRRLDEVALVPRPVALLRAQ